MLPSFIRKHHSSAFSPAHALTATLIVNALIALSIAPCAAVPAVPSQKLAMQEFELAWQLHAKIKPRDALPHINKAIALSAKKSAVFYCARATIKLGLDDYEGTLSDCNEAIKIDPKFAGPYRRRGFAYGALGQFDKAISDLTTALNLKQIDYFRWNDHYDLENRAKAYRSVGMRMEAVKDEAAVKVLSGIKQAYELRESINTRQALEVMNRVVKKQSDSIAAHYVRGICALNYDRNDIAIQDFTFILQKNSANIPVYYFRADAFSKAGKVDDAIKDYTHIINTNPQIVMASDLAETGRFEGNERVYDDLIVQVKDIYVLRAMQYRKLKKFDLAVKDLKKTLEIAPEDHDASITLASTYIDMNKCDEAIKVCSDLIAKKVSMRNAYHVKAQAEEKAGRASNAVDALSKIIAMDKEDLDGYLWRAVLYSRQKEYHKAIADYSKVLSIGKDEDIFALRADLYMKTGDIEKAIADYTSAIKHEPNASLYEGRAKAYEKLGRLDLAKRDREKINVKPFSLQNNKL